MKRVIIFIAIVSLVLMACKETKVVELKSALVDCEGVSKQKCLQYKEKGDDEWKLFYGEIEGFTYEEGYHYELEVDIEKVDNPPADGSSLKYTLKKLIKKERDIAMLEKKALVKDYTKLAQEKKKPFLVYSAMTRGYFSEMAVYTDHIAILKQRGGKPEIVKITKDNVDELNKIIDGINLSGIDKLESPTKKRHYDGAPFADVTVRKDGKEYKSASFDGGFPPKELELLVNKVLSLATEK